MDRSINCKVYLSYHYSVLKDAISDRLILMEPTRIEDQRKTSLTCRLCFMCFPKHQRAHFRFWWQILCTST